MVSVLWYRVIVQRKTFDLSWIWSGSGEAEPDPDSSRFIASVSFVKA